MWARAFVVHSPLTLGMIHKQCSERKNIISHPDTRAARFMLLLAAPLCFLMKNFCATLWEIMYFIYGFWVYVLWVFYNARCFLSFVDVDGRMLLGRCHVVLVRKWYGDGWWSVEIYIGCVIVYVFTLWKQCEMKRPQKKRTVPTSCRVTCRRRTKPITYKRKVIASLVPNNLFQFNSTTMNAEVLLTLNSFCARESSRIESQWNVSTSLTNETSFRMSIDIPLSKK